MNPEVPGNTPIPSAQKPKKWPWVMGCGCLTLFIIVLAVAAFIFWYPQIKEALNFKDTRVAPPVTPAQRQDTTSNNASAPEPKLNDERADWKTYDTTKEKIGSELKSHFVAFTFSYPPNFVAKPPEEGLFVILEKRAANGKDVAESFSVSWYETSDPSTTKEEFKDLKDLGTQWPQQYPQYNCKAVSTISLKVGGMGGVIGFGATWEFTTRDRNATFVAAARSILVHPPGQGRGVRIDQYGTWIDPKVKSASDVGENDDLAAILGTFKFLEASAQSPATTPPPDTTKSVSPLTAQDQQDIIAAAPRWLGLLDGGDYRASFAATAEEFRKDLTREQWGTTLSSMKKQFGAVVSRDDNVKLVTKTSDSEEGGHKVTYVLEIQTTFAKAAGTEHLSFVKEAGEWKVADYSRGTKNSR